MAPFRRQYSIMATARAAPSVGSVPAPSSSKRMRDASSHSDIMLTILLIWAEKVERFCSMLCSSPISARIWLNTGRLLPSSAGICNPHWFMAASRPMVFMDTVLPPVLGPVITRVSKLSPSSRLMGTALLWSSKGCRARRRTMPLPSMEGLWQLSL